MDTPHHHPELLEVPTPASRGQPGEDSKGGLGFNSIASCDCELERFTAVFSITLSLKRGQISTPHPMLLQTHLEGHSPKHDCMQRLLRIAHVFYIIIYKPLFFRSIV